jgi:flagellar biosynthesis/type III secretory pathway protein FliH
MDNNKTALERAFELAESATCGSVADIRNRVKAEGYAQQQIEGRSLTKQLAAIIKKAREAQTGPGTTTP